MEQKTLRDRRKNPNRKYRTARPFLCCNGSTLLVVLWFIHRREAAVGRHQKSRVFFEPFSGIESNCIDRGRVHRRDRSLPVSISLFPPPASICSFRHTSCALFRSVLVKRQNPDLASSPAWSRSSRNFLPQTTATTHTHTYIALCDRNSFRCTFGTNERRFQSIGLAR